MEHRLAHRRQELHRLEHKQQELHSSGLERHTMALERNRNLGENGTGQRWRC